LNSEARRVSLAAGLLLSVCGCERPAPATHATAASATPAASAPVIVTLLYTSDEHGWLLPSTEGGVVRGGAAEMLGMWEAQEGHCPGPPPPGEPPLPPNANCADPSTLALSGGDNFTGPAVSTYFKGEPMADAMAHMGYAASAFGNHEFDFGREQFVRDAARARLLYLAADLKILDPARKDVPIVPYAVFERRGVKIGVVGLATDQTLATAMASNFAGLTFGAEEPALDDAIGKAWKAGADAMVLIAHECADKLRPIVVKHPEWGLSFVGIGHCHKNVREDVAGIPFLEPGWRLEHYARVRLHVDPSRAARSRVLSTDAEVVEVGHPEGSPPKAPPDAPLAHFAAVWKQKTDDALGEPIGFTATGIDRDSPAMGRWIAGAWKAELGGDVAIVNDGGIRQSVPKGTITRATLWGLLPFDNRLVFVNLAGKDLDQELHNKEARFAGVSRAASGRLLLDGGAEVTPDHAYAVITTDFAYLGGSKFTFKEHDPAPKETGLNWRDPVIAWTKKLRTTPQKPLEDHLK
jgi:5'-nucleotidase / UDP-sugar diphosphatase